MPLNPIFENNDSRRESSLSLDDQLLRLEAHAKNMLLIIAEIRNHSEAEDDTSTLFI